MMRKIFLLLFLIFPCFLAGQKTIPDLLDEVPDNVGEMKNTDAPSTNFEKIKTGEIYQEKQLSFQGLILGTWNYKDQFNSNEDSDSKNFTTEINLIFQLKPSPLFQCFTDFGGKSYTQGDQNNSPLQKDHLVTNEIYFSSQLGHFNFNLGKKRLVIGSGTLLTPLDIFNPQKALPGQQIQKEGRYLAGMNFTQLYNSKTFSQLFADLVFYPEITQDENGLLQEMKFENNDFLLRLGGVFSAHEVTLFFFHRWEENWFGVSYSRYLTSNVELHLESLLFFHRKPVLKNIYTSLNKKLYQNTLLGIKYFLLSKMILTLDYYYQSDGLDSEEWDQATASPFIKQLTLFYLANQGTLYQRIPNLTLRRHYILGNVSYNNLWDYLNLNLSVILNPEDSATLLLPKIDYLPSANTSIGLGALLLPGKSGNHYESFGFDYMLIFDLNISF